MPSADPSNPQYSMIPQLTTQMSTLHLGTGSVSILTDYKSLKMSIQQKSLLIST